MLYKWEQFIEEGNELYMYMITNFNKMFEGNTTIKHFEIRDCYCNGINYADIITDNYYKDIQKELIIWIKKEYNDGILLNRELWKPFRNYNLIEMYYGYKKLFQYKHYYFQLGIESECMNNCIYCIEDVDSKHFILEIYGWKENEENILYPYRYNIPLDNIMPENNWETQ
jgi:hypothetical protein